MIKKIERSTIELADKLAKLEESLFGTAWDSFVINNKINNGKELFKNNDYPNFNEVRLEYMREPDVSFSTKSLEGKVNFHD